VVQKGYHWAQWASSLALLAGALALLVVAVGARRRFGADEPDFATLAFVLAIAGAFAAATHAAFDIAVLAKPSDATPLNAFPVDPRGFGTFALTGLALGLFGWLGRRGGTLTSTAGLIAMAAGACLVVVFLGRLIVLNPKSNAVKPFAVLSGLALSPATLVIFARSFLRPSG
jgi:hypothetical protein